MGNITFFEDKVKWDKYKVFVETGTAGGGGANWLASKVGRGYTIDVYDQYKERHPNVVFLLGESTEHLEFLCKTIEEPIVFWLDAHYPFDYGNGEHEVLPLVKELDLIAFYRQDYDDVILIDDLRIYCKGDYQSGNLPSGYQAGEVDIIEYIKQLFPERYVDTFREAEGYILVKN